MARDSKQITAIEIGRLLAAAGVIWLHIQVASPWKFLGEFAVPFFVFTSFYLMTLSIENHPQRSYRKYAFDRFVRIGYPLLVWNVVYLIVRQVSGSIGQSGMSWLMGIPTRGTAYHLWYLPFLLVTSLLAFPCIAWLVTARRKTQVTIAGILAAAAIIGAFVAPMPPDRGGGPGGLVRWVDGVPLVFMGIACGLVRLHEIGGRLRRIVLAGAVVGTLAAAAAIPYYEVFAGSLTGMFFGIVTLTCSTPDFMTRIGSFGRFSLGIYLIHVLVIELLNVVSPQMAAPLTFWSCVVSTMIIFVASLMASLLLSRFSATKAWIGL